MVIQPVFPGSLPMYKENIDYSALEPYNIPTPEGIQMLPSISKSTGRKDRDLLDAFTRLKEWIGYIPDIERAYDANFLTNTDEYKRIIKGLDDVSELLSGGQKNDKYVLQLLSQMYSDAAALQEKINILFQFDNVKEMPDGSLYGIEIISIDTSQLGYWERYILDPNHKPPLVHAMHYIGGTYYYTIRYKHIEGESKEFDGKKEEHSSDVTPRYTYYHTFTLKDTKEAVEWLHNHDYKLDFKTAGGTTDTYRLKEEELRKQYSKSIEAAIKRALNALAGTSIGSEIIIGNNPPKLWEPSHPYNTGGPVKPEVTPPEVPVPNPPSVTVDVSEWSESKLQQFLYGKILSYADLISLGLLPEDFVKPEHYAETLSGEEAFVIITLIRDGDSGNK